MFGKSVTLFRLFGFAVRVDISWLIILTLVVWSLAAGYFPQRVPGLQTSAYILLGLLGALGLFASIVFHELSHSLVARVFGLPIRGITLFVFGGVSEMTEEPPSAKAEFAMAVAGPLSSFVLGGILFGVDYFGSRNGWSPLVSAVVGYLAFINVILGAFNLLPGFPLDGGRVLRSILWGARGNLRWATRIASQVGGIFGLLLIGLGFLNVLRGNGIGGLWFVLIGMFLRSAAQQGYQQVLVREALAGEPVSRFMSADPIQVSPNLTLDHLVEDYIYRYHHKMYPVSADGRLAGCITTKEVRAVPREEWPRRTVRDTVVQCSVDNTVSPSEDAVNALAKMTRSGNSRLLVVDGDRLLGVVTLKDLMRFLSLKLELEGPEDKADRESAV